MRGKPVGVLQDLEQCALLGIAGHEHRSGLSAAQQAFARIDAEAGHRRFAVAGVTVGGQQRPDTRLEELDALRERPGLSGGGCGRRLAARARKDTDQRHHGQDQEDKPTTAEPNPG